MIKRASCKSITTTTPIKASTSAITAHTTQLSTSLSDLLPPSTKSLWDNDVCVLLSPDWEIINNVAVTNKVGASLWIRVRNSTAVGPVFSSTHYGTTGRDSQIIKVRPGLMAYRQFTTPDTRDAATFTSFDPQLSTTGASIVSPSSTDVMIEFITRHVGSVYGGTSGSESMLLPNEGGVECGLFWAISGFVASSGTTFEPIEWPQLPFEWSTFSDSNAEARVVAATGDETITVEEPRGSLLTGQDGVSSVTWNAVGVTANWPWLLKDYICKRLNRRPSCIWNAHGGAWQSGEMATNYREIWTEDIWPGLYGNPSTRLFKRRNSDAGWRAVGDRVTLGTFAPKLWLHTSFLNDVLRASLASALGTVTDTFSGAAIKDSTGKRAGSAGVIQKILDELPSTKILAIIGPATDDGASSGSFVSNTIANIWAALTGNDSAYFRFGSGEADSATGLAIKLSDYAATTGLSTGISYLHFTENENALVFDAIKSTVESWLHTALGIVFVDSVNGSNANAGTFSAPKQTIAGAGTSWSILALKRGSTFAETMTVGTSGTSGSPKVICAYGTSGANPIVYGGLGARNCATITARSYLTFNAIDFAGGIVGVEFATSANEIKFYDCNFYSNFSHGVSASVTGSGNVFERCTVYSNVGDGIAIASSISVTLRRCTVRNNTGNGVSIAGTATITDERSCVRNNSGNAYNVTAGTANLRNVQLATSTTGIAALGAALYATGGTVSALNCLIYNAAEGTAQYAISATGTSLLTAINCIIAGYNNDNSAYVRVGSTGVSGNVASMTNNVHDNYAGIGTTALKYVVWSGVGQPAVYAFAQWSALTNTSGATIESGSVNADAKLTASPLGGNYAALPLTGSAADNVGANLTATFSNDWRNKTRASSGSWDAGPWII